MGTRRENISPLLFEIEIDRGADSIRRVNSNNLFILELLNQCLRVQWEAVNYLVPAIQLPQIVWIVGSW